MKNIFLEKGKNDCLIVIPDDAHIVEKTASEELVNYIEKSLSVKLPVVSEKDANGKCIYVGHTGFAKKNGITGKSKENWIIKMADGNLVLTGGVESGDRGILYSVYHFLEEYAAVRWWSQFEEDVIELSAISLSDDLYKEGTPAFPYRKPLTSTFAGDDGVDKYAYLPRTRVNVLSPLDDGVKDGAYNPEVRRYGKVITMGRPHHCHVMGKYFPADEYFDEHPDWWAWNEKLGMHNRHAHYCFSNEGFFNALVERLLGYIKEDVELAEKTGVELPYYYSLSLDDIDAEYFFCQCPECKKIMEESGPSGYVIRFVNRVAREVKKIYPWAKFETLAYVVFAFPPKDDTVPDENVVIRLAYDRADMTHGFVYPSNKPYLEKLKTWSKLCSVNGAELQIWQYMFNIQVNFPLPLVYGLKSFIQTYREYGVKGVFIETEKVSADCHDLNTYVLYHLLEDPDCDVEALVEDFAHRYYGPAGKYVKEYLDILRDAQERNVIHAFCMCDDTMLNYIDARVAIDGASALDKAFEAVGDKEPYRARLSWLRKPFDGIVLSRYYDFVHQAESYGEVFAPDRKVLKERIVAALEEHDKFLRTLCPFAILQNTPTQDEIEYYKNLPDEEEVLDIPEFFRDVDPKDIYQFRMVDNIKVVDKRLRPVYGFYPVADEDTTVKSVLKISYDDCRGKQREFIMAPTSKDAEKKNAVSFNLWQDDHPVCGLELYREDFIQGGYNIYKVGSLENLKDYPDSSLIVYDYAFLSVRINGIAVTMPMDACEVYISIKPSGEMYGGKAGEENALFVDRMIVVRKK